MLIGGNHSGGQGSAPHMGGPTFNNSRDEFELKYAELSYGSSQLGSDSSLAPTQKVILKNNLLDNHFLIVN